MSIHLLYFYVHHKLPKPISGDNGKTEEAQATEDVMVTVVMLVLLSDRNFGPPPPVAEVLEDGSACRALSQRDKTQKIVDDSTFPVDEQGS